MRGIISISLPERARRQLTRIAKKRDLTMSELVREALRKYLISEEFNRIRKKTLAKLARTGKVYSDEDVFKIVS